VGSGAEGDAGAGGADGVVEVGEGDPGRGRGDAVGVGGVGAVEAEQDVEVDRAACLVLSGLAVGDSDDGDAVAGGEVAASPGELLQVPFDVLLGAPP